MSFGEHAGKSYFIPRVNIIPSDTELPFEFKRCQFSIGPAFCMTINKSQGQTLDFVGWPSRIYTWTYTGWFIHFWTLQITIIYFLITFTIHLIARFVAYSKGNLMMLNSINKNKTKTSWRALHWFRELTGLNIRAKSAQLKQLY